MGSGPLAASRSTETTPPQRVAIIGVHGVGDHAPGATANAIADLLLSLPSYEPGAPTPSAHKQFSPFDSTSLRIPAEPVLLTKAQREKADSRDIERSWWDAWDESSTDFGNWLSRRSRADEFTERTEAGVQWSINLLWHYQGGGEGNQYVTNRLEGKREQTHGAPEQSIHIYEVLWADIVRPASSILGFLLALFQLVLHVPSLSRLALDSKRCQEPEWRLLRKFHTYACRVLQVFLPTVQVMLLIELLAAAPTIANLEGAAKLIAAGIGFLVTIGWAWLLSELNWFPSSPSTRLRWVITVLTPGVLASCLVLLAGDSGPQLGLTLCVWIFGAIVLNFVIDAYQSTRSGIARAGWSAYAATIAAFLLLSCVNYCAGDAPVQMAHFWLAQWLIAILRWLWIGMAICAFGAAILGEHLSRSGSEAEKAEACAAVRTSRLGLALPLFLFVVCTGVIWAGLFSVADRIAATKKADSASAAQKCCEEDAAKPGHIAAASECADDVSPAEAPASGNEAAETETEGSSPCPPAAKCCESKKSKPYISAEVSLAGKDAPGSEFIPWRGHVDLFPYAGAVFGGGDGCGGKCGEADYLRASLSWGMGYGTPIMVIVVMLGLHILILWALPSALTEKFPPRIPTARLKRLQVNEPPRRSTDEGSVWLGNWVSRGLDSTAFITFLIWGAVFVIPIGFLFHFDSRVSLETVTQKIVCAAILVTASAGGLAAVARYASPVMRCILDVDTYMRTGPEEGNPRSLIFERYVSLLRYVANFKDADGQGYDRIVIVAHSLGAVISADLLCLLKNLKSDEELAALGYCGGAGKTRIPVSLFTVGNPLRQLLNRFFPYLYQWVSEYPENGGKPLPPVASTPPEHIAVAALPDPDDLGIAQWSNAYRSGDYVGRSLWLDGWYQRKQHKEDSDEKSSEQSKRPDLLGEPTKVQDSAVAPRRIEFCIGGGAHTHYLDDTAPDIARHLAYLLE